MTYKAPSAILHQCGDGASLSHALRCEAHRSALQWPMHCAAMADAAHCTIGPKKVPCGGRVACQMMLVGLNGGWESGKSYGVFACLFLRIHVFFRQEAVSIGLS